MLGLVVLPAGVLVEFAVLDQPDAVREALDERAVVADDGQGGAGVGELGFQGLNGEDVEVPSVTVRIR